MSAWEKAGGAWEPLATLAGRVERELGFSQIESVKVLRPVLERGGFRGIPVDVIGWQILKERSIADHANWVRQNGPWLSPTDTGWRNVDWHAGTLAGYELRIAWAQTVKFLEG